MREILKTNNLWGGYKEGVDILRGISMEVRQGETVGIIGLNGSGKSTFGKAIMNMIPIRKGEIVFLGEDVTSLTTNQLAHRGISIMQQGGKVFSNLSVWENLQLALLSNNNKSYSFIGQLFEIIPLLQRSKKDLQTMMADKLSGGQKHQLALAMSLATNPLLMILDEPSAGLSPKSVDEMYTVLRAVRKERDIAIILVEQNIAKAVDFCDSSIMLRQGVSCKIQNKGDLKEIENLLFNK